MFDLGGQSSPGSLETDYESKLGDLWRDSPERSGLEPELGGENRQKAVYVDEVTCIGCKHCAHVAPNTFSIEAEFGRSRVFNQDGDLEETVQEAIETCPVDCIHSVDYNNLPDLEIARQKQVVRQLGLPQVNPVIKFNS